MKAKAALVALGVLAIVMVGCAAQMVVPGADVADGIVSFQAKGTSVVTKEGDDLSMVEARVAAATMAKAELLAKIKGVVIGSNVTVGDLIFESQEAKMAVNGFLARADVTYEPVEPSKIQAYNTVTAIATLRMSCAQLAALEEYVE